MMVYTVATVVFLVVLIGRTEVYRIWNNAARNTELRYRTKAIAWTLGVAAFCYDIVFLLMMIRIASLYSGINLQIVAMIATLLVLGADIVIIRLLYQDDDNDPLRDAFGKLKNMLKSAFTLHKPQPVTASNS